MLFEAGGPFFIWCRLPLLELGIIDSAGFCVQGMGKIARAVQGTSQEIVCIHHCYSGVRSHICV